MRDEHGGRAGCRQRARDGFARLDPQGGIERRKRFVEQHQRRATARAPAPARRVAAARRKAVAARARDSRAASRPAPAAPPPDDARGAAHAAARTRCSPPPTDAETARLPAAHSRCADAPTARCRAVGRPRAARRFRSCRHPRARSRTSRRSSVVLPLPDGPSSASSVPRSTTRSTPCSTAWPSKALRRPLMRSSLMEIGECRGVAAAAERAEQREQQARRAQRDADQQRRIGRGGGEGERRRVGPDLRRERVRVDRREQQRRVEFGDDRDEDHRRRRAEARAGERQHHAPNGLRASRGRASARFLRDAAAPASARRAR